MANKKRRTKTKLEVDTKQLAAASNSNPKYGKKPNLIDTRGSDTVAIDYFHLYESLYRKEISDWQQARDLRRNPFMPMTYQMQQLYKDSMLDNRLFGAIDNRILRTLNKEFVLKDANDIVDKKRSAYIQTKWFRHIVRRALESKFYGYSLIYVNDLNTTERVILDLPRENVIPEKNILIKNPFDINSDAINYKDFPNYFMYIELGSDSIGQLERVAPLTIYKRHSWASWDEFEQIFGIPLRIAKTQINNDKHLSDLQYWLETMGTASYAIFDKMTDIDIKENKQSDAFNVFFQKIQAINKEISFGVVGQTMTMDDGSSQSQAEVHMEIYNEIISSDITDIQDWVTDEVLPILRFNGFDIPEGYYMSIQEKLVIKPLDKIKIDQILLQNGFNITPEYVTEFYGTPLDAKNPRQVAGGTAALSRKNSVNNITDFFP